ncbi:MAG: hypothetical protein JXR27_11040 [Paludibacteraceae bacterium]|nr:hypothetical protein [Paludibacteraceae bacterium]
MKTTKYIVAALMSVALWTNAQTLDQNVTVEREFKPVIQDAGKISSVPQVMELNVQKSPAEYTDFNFPMAVGQNIHTLPAAELLHQRRRTPSGSFVRLGLGSELNNMLEFALPIINKPKTKLDLKVDHLATFGSKKHSVSNAALMFDQYFSKFDLYAGVGAGRESFNYYGNNFLADGNTEFSDFTKLLTGSAAAYDELNLVRVNRTAQLFTLDKLSKAPENDVFWRLNSYVGVRSLPGEEKLRYQAEVQYKAFDARNGLTENIIQTRAGFNNQNGKNRMGLDIEMSNMMYKSDVIAAVINVWNSYSVFSMNPYYSIERERFDMRLGVKSSFSFVHGKPFNPSPDINLEWRAIPKFLAVYGGVGGGYEVNTMDDMFRENRWLYSDLRIKDTYTPVNPYVGLKVKPIYNLLLDAYLSYSYIDNQYFFVNKDYKYDMASSTALGRPAENILFTNRFNVLYSSASHTKVGVRANYNIRNFINVQLKGAYNGWQVYETLMAWNKPKWEADLSTDLRLSRNLNVSANVFYEGKRYAKLGEGVAGMHVMNPKVDINLAASYSYLNWFTMFAKVNNLINNKYEEYYGYQVQGLNFMVGAAFSF